MSVTTPNMNLIESTIGVDSGLVWEQNLNADLTIIDGHNHSAGFGVQINPTGIDINSDLTFGNNNATNVRSVRFQPQVSPLSGLLDLGVIYESGVDLWYNDANGNQIQLTMGGAVNATSSGISSGTATASFVSGVLVVNAAPLTPANIQVGSVLLGNNVANSNFLTLSPPSAMASNFSLVLPNVPIVKSIVTIDTSGNMAADTTVDGTTISIISNVIQLTPALRTLPTVQRFLTGSGTYTTPANCLYMKITMAGGGGGGAREASQVVGSAGGDSTFGTSLLTASGGFGGNVAAQGGLGGAATVSSPAIAIVALTGGAGGGATGQNNSAGGPGGNNPFGGAAAGGSSSFAPNNSVDNTGAGGEGGGGNSTSGGAGGGAGGYLQAYIETPVSSYSYSVGAAGAGGTFGPPGQVADGGNGGSGVIIVEEFYNT